MIVNGLDLERAVAEGIISRDQAERLRDLTERDHAMDDSSIGFSQESDDEPFRLLRGFRDFFIAIGIIILALGLTTFSFSQLGKISDVMGDWEQIRGKLLWGIFVTLGLCVFGFLQAEYITRRQRLPLSSLVVAVAFTGWCALFAILTSVYLASSSAESGISWFSAGGKTIYWSAAVGSLIGAGFFYWRYRLPFALLLLAASVVVLSLMTVGEFTSADWIFEHGRLLIGLWGMLIFGAAMWFDLRDRLRVTRLSECAFWLHLSAAPMLVHALLFGEPGHTPGIAYVMGTMALLSVAALIIDRRALLVSGLSYFTIAVGQLVSDSLLTNVQSFAFTAFVLGAVMLTLGLGWMSIRRGTLAIIPFDGVKSRLPPAAA